MIIHHVYSCSPASSRLAGRHLSGSSPLSRSDKLLLQTGQQHNKIQEKEKTHSSSAKDEDVDESFFETSILSFMESLNLQDKDLDNIQLIDVREKLEQIQGREFSPQEKRIFIAVVKKYVMSLKCKKFSNVKLQHVSQSIKTEHCSKEEFAEAEELNAAINLPHSSYSTGKNQISENECDENNRNNGTGWLNTERDYCTGASTSKTNIHIAHSPSVRRNLISLEDSHHTQEGIHHTEEISGKLVSGDRCFRSDNSRETSVCVMQQDSKKMLKRKSSEIDGSNKKCCALDSDKCDSTDSCEVPELQEINPDSEQSTSKNLVECPICRGEFSS
jgi:hypothetical protein